MGLDLPPLNGSRDDDPVPSYEVFVGRVLGELGDIRKNLSRQDTTLNAIAAKVGVEAVITREKLDSIAEEVAVTKKQRAKIAAGLWRVAKVLGLIVVALGGLTGAIREGVRMLGAAP